MQSQAIALPWGLSASLRSTSQPEPWPCRRW